MRVLTLALAALALVPLTANAYIGSLVSTDMGILGTGNWITNGPTMLSWDVHFDANAQNWLYSYDFVHPEGATSHFILEVSPTFTDEDIISTGGTFGGASVEWWSPGGSNPGMPETIWGIKFDEAWGDASHFELRTLREPVWGDFYAKDGQAGGYGFNAAWNAGFTNPDTDPVGVGPMDGSVQHHLLVPDTGMSPVPEPTTLLLLGPGLLGMAAYLRRRRR